MRVRKYKSYNDYIDHQKKKTLKRKVRCVSSKKFGLRVERFKKLFSQLPKYLPEKATALCLGARRGEEIEALKSYGYKPLGVDLVAFPPDVIEADFHNLPFEDNSFDFIFSNAVDHILEIDKFAKEVTRVVRKGGYVLFHLVVNDWSDEMSFGINNPSEVFNHFGNKFKRCEDFKMKGSYGGGLNRALLMKKTKK